MLLTSAIYYAEAHQETGAIVMVDQEKAYDRIHRRYLRCIHQTLKLPVRLIDSIMDLFGSTNVHLNINGHVAARFPQARGLRQGDPLSPLFINIAIEPLIRMLQYSPHLAGFSIPTGPNVSNIAPLRVLAYADDIAIVANSLVLSKIWQV